MEVKPNTTIIMHCSMANDSMWSMPSTDEDKRERFCLESLDEGLTLKIRVHNESDMGTYSCQGDDFKTITSVYVYVSDPKRKLLLYGLYYRISSLLLASSTILIWPIE